MNKHRSRIACALCLAAALASQAALAQASGQTSPPPATRPAKVVASTSWVAAFARAAGARDIVVIAPVNLRHPPEYEIKPSDLLAAKDAALILYSGYEKFAKRLAETSAESGTRIMKVYTDNPPAVVTAEAKKIAQALGTIEAYEAWAASFEACTASMRSRIATAYSGKKVLVHKFLRTYVEWLGLEVAGSFGPGELSPATLLELSRTGAQFVIDNYHNPSGKALAESLGAEHVELINFPGKDGTVSIEDVFTYNEKRFAEAAARR